MAKRKPDAITTAYDRIAALWREDRLALAKRFRERPFVDRLTAPLAAAARVLDVGCGCGEPIAAYLASRGFEVVGVDGSKEMLDFARRAVPTAEFVLGDMRTAEVSGTFDAIVAWDSVFHLPCADHSALFARFRSWLNPKGRLLLSLGGSGGDVASPMHGQTFSYSAHEPPEALRLLERSGFAIEHWEVDDPTSHGHIAVLAAAT